ncbi:hypothetical protein E3O45_05915 [Cryobacterium sp. TMS1-20-1]|uniref:hypothetical protein n=1 Tax=Cryobacterium sp. TMS1-20-1 TaxID=1259223 RepID=UPI00106D76F2|nr:hypothetical protein [Cryobacterium sp. TMS1-20-1]TFC78148.1 hypothetical protein E3O45_05915 [Cryobacterium sp. TMS1-20-1]
MSNITARLDPAWNTPCEFADCTRRYHDPHDVRTNWRHEVFVAEGFDEDTVQAELSVYSDGRPPIGSIDYMGNGDLQTAADYRREADIFEAFPAWLRSLADRLDRLDEQPQPAST